MERLQTARTQRPPDHVGARRWLWRTVVILIVGTWAGSTWDSIWHATEPFDGFWSPPHLIIYAAVTFIALIVMGMVFTDPIRHAFGKGFKVFFLPFKVPGALFILSGGMVMLGMAGAVFDNIWHTAFGLNETPWSFPHAMIGASLMVITFGVLSCRLALNPAKPMPWSSKLLVGWLLILTMASFLGPLSGNRTPQTVDFFFTYIPTLANQDSAQHLYRIYETWNLNRTHPALMLLAPLWLGAALGLLRKLDGRWWLMTAILLLSWSADFANRDLTGALSQYIVGFEDEANWRALPIMLPFFLWLLLLRLRVSERVAYALAGVLFSLMIFGIWGVEGSGAWLLALLAAPVMLLGKAIGERTYRITAEPNSFRTVLPLMLSTLVIPAATGIVDLILRLGTP
jgi:hypothetical protein